VQRFGRVFGLGAHRTWPFLQFALCLCLAMPTKVKTPDCRQSLGERRSSKYCLRLTSGRIPAASAATGTSEPATLPIVAAFPNIMTTAFVAITPSVMAFSPDTQAQFTATCPNAHCRMASIYCFTGIRMENREKLEELIQLKRQGAGRARGRAALAWTREGRDRMLAVAARLEDQADAFEASLGGSKIEVFLGHPQQVTPEESPLARLGATADEEHWSKGIATEAQRAAKAGVR
jgi:hypothetical protein